MDARDRGDRRVSQRTSSTSAGDFDGDGFADLAMGAPAWELPQQVEISDNGVTWISYGQATGLELPTGVGKAWYQGVGGVPGVMESNDQMGRSLRTGDFNGDGYTDLVIGVSGEDNNLGAVNVIFGSGSKLTGAGSLVLY